MKYITKIAKNETILNHPNDFKTDKKISTEKEEWWILEPPFFKINDLMSDLKSLWQKEFQGSSWYQKIIFCILRIIQHLAYRRGYGNEKILAELPLPYHPDFTIMEKNLEEILISKRMNWLHAFLGHINNPDKGKKINLPSLIIFELSNTCNYNCLGCGVGQNGIQFERFMDVENLRRWSALCCHNAKLIRINGLGEATLHPRLLECLDILAQYPGGREIITNGSASLEIYEYLLASHFVILISWDACEAGLFEKIRYGADFRTMRFKLPHITAKAKQYKAPYPVLLFTFREQNMNQLEGTLHLAAEAEIRRVTVNMFKQTDNSDWTISYHKQIREIFEKAEDLAARLNIDLALPDHIGDESFHSSCSCSCFKKCPFPYEQVVIRYNGDLTPCNMMNPYVYGNISQSKFSMVWNSPEAQIFREFSGTSYLHSYCSYCYYVHTPNKGLLATK